MNRVRTPLAVACLVIAPFLCQQRVLAQADPRLGTWKLNLAKSVYESGPPPQSEMRTYTDAGGGSITVKAETVTAAGTTESTGYTAKKDGKDYPLTSPVGDTISMKGTGGSGVDAQLKKGGKVVQTTQSVVSKDGKTLTLTSKGTTADGKPFTNIRVYDKQ